MALAVVASHTGLIYPIGGREAVTLFFMISGFYMAMILNTRYVGPGSAWRFYKSRYIKIWVPFFVVTCLFLIGASLTSTTTVFSYVNKFPWWLSVATVGSNIFIFGQDLVYLISYREDYSLHLLPYGEAGWNGNRLALNLVIFSISLELYFYLLAPFILRSFNRVVVFTLLGFLWFLWLTLINYNGIDLKYHFFPSSFLYFGLGATAYWISKIEEVSQYKLGILVIIVILMCIPWISLITQGIVVVAFFFTISTAFGLSKNSRLDRFVGELSYPVYLIHLPIIILFQSQFNSEHLFFYTAFFSLIFSYVMCVVIEKPLNSYRERFSQG